MQHLRDRFFKTYFTLIGIWLVFVIIISVLMAIIYVLSSTAESAVLYHAVHSYFETHNDSWLPFALIWLCLVVLSLFAVGFTVLSRLTCKIITPLSDLGAAAEQIRAGEYDTEIIGAEDKEINELCLALDKMRMYLKERHELDAAVVADRNLLIANISHDMRTPVTTIKGYLQAISDGVADTPEQIENCYAHIRAKTEFLERLATDMTEYSDQESGRLRYHFETVELCSFLGDMAGEYADETQRKGFVFSVSYPDTPVYIRGDRYRLQRVLQNLLSNAIKYNKPGGSIAVIMEVADGYAYIRVADSGIGVSGDSLKRVFDSFYREDASRGNVSGHGLGLAIARQIVLAHRGKIWMQSRENSGTEVFLCLPLTGEKRMME